MIYDVTNFLCHGHGGCAMIMMFLVFRLVSLSEMESGLVQQWCSIWARSRCCHPYIDNFSPGLTS